MLFAKTIQDPMMNLFAGASFVEGDASTPA